MPTTHSTASALSRSDDLAAPTKAAGALCAGNHSPLPVQWLWPGKIPIGKVTLLVGDPGVGKSLLALDIAARVSREAPWPDNAKAEGGRGRGEGDPSFDLRPTFALPPSPLRLSKNVLTKRPRRGGQAQFAPRTPQIEPVPGRFVRTL